MSSYPLQAPLIEPRAKRTHARRSCDLCKIRKTRCELPDLDLPSSSDPLPSHKACHRCRVLELPCVIDDRSRKQRKRIRDTGWTSPKEIIRQLSPKAKQPQLGATQSILPDMARRSNLDGVDYSLDLLPDSMISDMPSSTSLLAPPSAFLNLSDHLEAVVKRVADWQGTQQSQSLRLHGRPLVAACAMLRVVYGARNDSRIERGAMTLLEVDMSHILDGDMAARLEPGSVVKSFP